MPDDSGRAVGPVAGLAALGERTIAGELDDALYYLRHDCIPCAERHFELARGLCATEEMIAQVRDQADLPHRQ